SKSLARESAAGATVASAASRQQQTLGRRPRSTIVIVSVVLRGRFLPIPCYMCLIPVSGAVYTRRDFMITGKEALSLLGTSASRWNAHNAPRLGASLAYYALLSLAPLSILLVAIASLMFSRSAAESNLLQ